MGEEGGEDEEEVGEEEGEEERREGGVGEEGKGKEDGEGEGWRGGWRVRGESKGSGGGGEGDDKGGETESGRFLEEPLIFFFTSFLLILEGGLYILFLMCLYIPSVQYTGHEHYLYLV